MGLEVRWVGAWELKAFRVERCALLHLRVSAPMYFPCHVEGAEFNDCNQSCAATLTY